MLEADALRRIEDLQAETDRISEGIRADIEPRERESDRRQGAADYIIKPFLATNPASPVPVFTKTECL